MGLFWPSITDEAVYRKMELVRARLWGKAGDNAASLDLKEKQIEQLAADLLKTEDGAIRKSQQRWIADARNSIKHRRYLLTREAKIRAVRV